MAYVHRYRTATSAGVVAALALVLIFGSPAYGRWVEANVSAGSAGGWFLHQLAWPAWRFDSDQTVESVIAADIKAILVVLFAGLFLVALPGSQLARARGGISQFLAGWAAYIFAAAFAGFLASFLMSNPGLLTAFNQGAGGAIYGLFSGWIVGAAALGGHRGTTP